MRSVKFRDVLWAVARKAGFSPESGNFITNQALPVAEYINDWVARLYTQEDWPEWTKVNEFIPNPTTHIVRYSSGPPPSPVAPDIQFPGSYNIYRVFDVYLLDPKTTRAPISTKYTLREDGIHCGFEHGQHVWIKYIEPAPEFTAVLWRADNTYKIGETVYSPETGECYVSLINNNRGNDPTPSTVPGSPPPSILIEEIQLLEGAQPGVPAQDEIVDLFTDYAAPTNGTTIPDPIPIGNALSLTLIDTAGAVLASHTQTQAGTTSIVAMLTALKADFDGDALPGFTFTVDTPTKKLRVRSSTTEFLIAKWNYIFDSGSTFSPLSFVQVQPFSAGSASVDITPQKLKITIGQNQFYPGALYTLSVIDETGTRHEESYQSGVFDDRLAILNGLSAAIGASTDSVVNNIQSSIETVEPSLTLSLIRVLGVDVTLAPPVTQFWKVIPFPEALFNPVVRGAGADLLAEWGQNATATGEEGKVQSETTNASGDFETTRVGPLTTQQRPLSRYKL
jgi:hypothetical protein